jgi:3-oxoacyl-[acyl-carrier-protein] synthase III
MIKSCIKAISYYLPEHVLTNEELVKEFPEWTIDKVASKIGISERHIASDSELSSDMAVNAAQLLFEEYAVDPKTIDFILFCTQSPDYFLPTSACIIQEKLGVPITAGALDFNLGCSGFVYGLSLAKGLIAGGIAKNVLLLTAETYSKYIHPNDKGNRTIFGDAAAATLISTEGFAEIGNFDLGTDGRGAEKLIVKSGGLRNREKKDDLSFNEGNPISSDHLFMDGMEIFNFTLDSVPVLVSRTLFKNDLSQSEIDLFIFHQANRYMLNFLRKKIKIEEGKFYYALEKFGNTVSSTIPIAIKEAINDSTIHPGMNVLIAGFGVGYSWAGAILKINQPGKFH